MGGALFLLVFSSNRENFKLRLEGMLGFIDVQGSEGFDDSKIEELSKSFNQYFSLFLLLILSHLSYRFSLAYQFC